MRRILDDENDIDASHRAAWMGLLARAPIDLLEMLLGRDADRQVHWLRRPETGLVMVQGRVGGTGSRFNLGETTVTRCALRLGEGPEVGIGYVRGRSHRHATLVAIGDALLQHPARLRSLEASLLAPIRDWLEGRRSERRAQADSTRVEFFTVARESGGNDEGGPR